MPPIPHLFPHLFHSYSKNEAKKGRRKREGGRREKEGRRGKEGERTGTEEKGRKDEKLDGSTLLGHERMLEKNGRGKMPWKREKLAA